MQEKNVSRRAFIKGAVAASAAFGIPSIVTATVLGADAPSNRINAGLIGCGNIGNYHASHLNTDFRRVLTVI